MRILGIDPSVRILGWGVIEKHEQAFKYVASDTVYTNPAEVMSIRLGKLFQKIEALCEEYKPEVIALETAFVQNDPSAAFKISYVQGIVMAVAGIKAIQMKEVAPTEVKKTLTSSGRAGKEQVRAMLFNVLSHNGIKFSSYDQSDALAIAYTAAVYCDFVKLNL